MLTLANLFVLILYGILFSYFRKKFIYDSEKNLKKKNNTNSRKSKKLKRRTLKDFYNDLKSDYFEVKYPKIKCENCEKESETLDCPHCGETRTGSQDGKELVKESTEEVTGLSLDLLQTFILLLFKPGRTTNYYFYGEKKEFAPPIRFYFVITFIFFLLLKLQSVDWSFVEKIPSAIKEIDVVESYHNVIDVFTAKNEFYSQYEIEKLERHKKSLKNRKYLSEKQYELEKIYETTIDNMHFLIFFIMWLSSILLKINANEKGFLIHFYHALNIHSLFFIYGCFYLVVRMILPFTPITDFKLVFLVIFFLLFYWSMAISIKIVQSHKLRESFVIALFFCLFNAVIVSVFIFFIVAVHYNYLIGEC